MKITFDDIENAFMFVSLQSEFGNQALLSKTTGKIILILLVNITLDLKTPLCQIFLSEHKPQYLMLN